MCSLQQYRYIDITQCLDLSNSWKTLQHLVVMVYQLTPTTNYTYGLYHSNQTIDELYALKTVKSGSLSFRKIYIVYISTTIYCTSNALKVIISLGTACTCGMLLYKI